MDEIDTKIKIVREKRTGHWKSIVLDTNVLVAGLLYPLFFCGRIGTASFR